jgi:hypothetical protein
MGMLKKGSEDRDNEKRQIMAWTKRLHEALVVFEPLRHAHKHIDNLLKSCLWPESVFCRETICGAEERHFEALADDSMETLEDASKAFGTKSVEDQHRCLNAQQHRNLNGKLCRHSRYHVALNAGVIEEMDRVRPPIDPDIKAAAARTQLNKDQYCPTSKDFSLGEECYNDLICSKDIELLRAHPYPPTQNKIKGIM